MGYGKANRANNCASLKPITKLVGRTPFERGWILNIFLSDMHKLIAGTLALVMPLTTPSKGFDILMMGLIIRRLLKNGHITWPQ